MDYQVKEANQEATIYLEGELDMAVGVKIGTLIREVGERNDMLVLDFAQVSFIDSAGIGNLFYATKDLLTSGKQVVITHVKEEIRDILEVLRFAEALGIQM